MPTNEDWPGDEQHLGEQPEPPPGAIDMRRLGLGSFEMRLLRYCIWAWTQTSNGHFLPPPRMQKAATRLINRGWLSAAPKEAQPQPQMAADRNMWRAVVLTADNQAALNAAHDAAKAEKAAKEVPADE